MKAIAYWDIDSLRIRKVLDELGSGFDVRMAATLGELQIYASDRGICALIVGLPPTDQEGVASFLATIAGPRDCPVFVLGEEQCSPLSDPPRADREKSGYFMCPGELSSLRQKILASADKRKMTEEDSVFIGRSAAMREVATLVRKYADSRHPVLILGETGTGKELVACAIHTRSSRRDKPFIALNCSALPENLVESELFGAEKGAFTDAVRHRGALARAAKGSLFLDEIGSMALSVQPKLLRALETGEYWMLGAEKPEKSDFRLICATCEDLEQQIERGFFRKDLFYRISDLPINVPPLRDRVEDVADLAEHFCFQASKGYCELSAAALAKLMAYRWPGNVRELKSVINRACANVQRGSIGDGDITFMFALRDPSGRGPRP